MGFVFPFFYQHDSFQRAGNRRGEAISSRIGVQDKSGADNIAVHTIILILLLALVFTVPFYLFAPQIFVLVGAGKTADLAVAYSRVIFPGSILIFFTNVANAILRSEGILWEQA